MTMNATRPVLMAAVLTALLLAPSAVGAQTYGIGTNPQGSLFYAIGAGIAKVVSTKTDLKLRVQPYAGTTTLLPLLNQGRLDFAVLNPIEAILAYRGERVFEGRKNDKLRVLTTLFPTFTGVLVRADSDIKTLADLKGRRMPHGYTSQRVVGLMIEAYLANGGVSYADMKPVPVANIIAAADLFAAGKVCCSVHLVGTAAVEQLRTKLGGVRYLSISDAPDAIARMRAIGPGTYVSALTPSKRRVGVVAKTNFMSWDAILVTATHVSDGIAKSVAQAMHDNKKDLIAMHGVFRRFAPKRMYKPRQDIPYHDGVLGYYSEKGYR